MPPRGELSGQESNGATSDIGWARIHYEVGSGTSTSYDVLARDIWGASDDSDVDTPPARNHQRHVDLDDDTPTIVQVSTVLWKKKMEATKQIQKS